LERSGRWEEAGVPLHLLVNTPAALQAVAAALDNTTLVGLDLETTGLDPRTDRVRLLSLSTDTIDGGTFTYLVDCTTCDPSPLWEALADKELVIHNAAFDLAFLARLGFTPSGPVHDTMLLARVLEAGGRHFQRCRLADCCARYLGLPLAKDLQRSDWAGELTGAQLAYAARDADVLGPLYQALAPKVKAAGLGRVADIESRALPAFVWLARSGVAFDRDAWDGLTREAEQAARELAARLDAAAPPRPGFLIGAGAWDWDSPQQVKAAFEAAGVALASSEDEALARVGHPMAALLREYRAARKRVTTYGTDWGRHAAADGRVYAAWNQLGSVAGRASCSGPNLQQVPRDVRYRRCFVAPPGRVLVKADYSQLQLRIAAKIADEKRMLAAYATGEDLHTLTALQITGQAEATKGDRQLAKAVNFGLLFGLGAKGLRDYAKSNYGLDLTLEQAAQYRRSFFATYPGLERWHRRAGNAKAAECRTLAGRRRLLDGKTPYTHRLNTPVQGTEADGLKLALALLWERRAACPGAFPVLVVHDEIVVECDADQAGAAAAWVKQAMLDGMAPLIDPVPVEVEVKVGRTWGDAVPGEGWLAQANEPAVPLAVPSPGVMVHDIGDSGPVSGEVPPAKPMTHGAGGVTDHELAEALTRDREAARSGDAPERPRAAAGDALKAASDGAEPGQGGAAALDDRDALRRRAEKADKERCEFERAQADLADRWKRIDRDLAQERRYAHGPLAADLLPALGNLERATAAVQQAGETGPVMQGVALVQAQLLDILQRHGITRIEALGQPFDPNLHQAVMQKPTAEAPPSTVVQVLEPGYMIHERVLRPAGVAVSTSPGWPPEGSPWS
jgi:DNA polymerase-1